MKLLKCHIENFGKLSNLDVAFDSGCTVILKENGWGKSTLAAFLKVMFYGFANERSKDDLVNERKRYRPWQGGIYGGTLLFEAGEKVYEVTRTFGMKEKEDTFTLRDMGTNLVSHDYTKNLGEELFSIDLNSFERTVFLSQNDCVTEATDRIHARIGRMAENQEENVQFEKVMERLTQQLNHRTPNRKTGTLYKKKEQIAEAEMETSKIKYLEESMNKIKKQQKELKESYEKCKKEQRYLTEERKRAAALLEERILRQQQLAQCAFNCKEAKQYEILNQLLCEGEPDVDRILKVFYEEDCFDEMRDQEDWKRPVYQDRFGILFIMLGLMILFGGMMWQFFYGFPGGIAACFGAVFCVLSCYMMNEQKKRWLHIEKEYEFQRIWYLFEDAHEELTEKYIRYQKLSEGHKKEVPSIEVIDARNNEILSELELIYQEQLECKSTLEQLIAEQRELYELQSRLERWKEEWEKEREQYHILQLTCDYLKDAKASFASRYLEPLRNGFARYYEILAGESAESYILDTDLVLTKREMADVRELSHLSAGYQDLTGLCMRMALVDAMYREELPFLILDDPFVNLDGEKLQGAGRLLSGISKKYQVLYFICHESRNVL